MLKLKKNVIDFLKANVKPEYFDKACELILKGAKEQDCHFNYGILNHQSKNNVPFYISFTKLDFEEPEELKPYVWYPAEKFDGNPNGYWIIEQEYDGSLICYYDDDDCYSISGDTIRFMYIEPFEEQDHDEG